MTTTTAAMTNNEKQTGRTYKVFFGKVAPYPLNWDETIEKFDSLEAAMEAAEAFMKRYPKGIATRTRWVRVTSHAGVKEIGRGSSGYLIEVDRKVHLDTSKKKAK
jgi:predicted metal-dependent RNase